MTIPSETINTKTTSMAEAARSHHTCTTCKQRPKTMLLLPCSHLAACEQCVADMSCCPMCSRTVSCVIRTFII
ncbi:hypothetical protein DPMN_050173 [Dreissena polymorpha]|uniref:RING-type domain-containing protein n=1 Tax=Dreissena polymorpha TaxID=45954 RepID=A0A9D4CH11_DREPO|nr:hypothetical protein DPMN_050173 [Dreissena polymorpha]